MGLIPYREGLTVILEESPELTEFIEVDVGSTVDSLVEELEESGVIAEDLSSEAGSTISTVESEVEAGMTVLRKLKGRNIVLEYLKIAGTSRHKCFYSLVNYF